MTGYLDRAVLVARGVANGARSDQITFIAASLAYYAFISLVPLLLLSLVVASTVGDDQIVARVVAAVASTFGPEAGTVVDEALTGAAGRGGATIVGLLVLLWSGLRLFRGLDVAFSAVYGVGGPPSIVAQFRNGAVTLVAVGLAVASTVAVGVVLTVVGVEGYVASRQLTDVLATATLLAGLTAVFLPLYYFLPGPDVTLREALPGAAFAALGWTVLQIAFRVYAGYAATYEAYGVLGGLLLLVTFLYFGALVLLLGVVINAVLAGRAAVETGLAEPDRSTPEPSAVLEEIMTADPSDDGTDAELREQLERLYDELDRFEERVETRTVHRREIEGDLERYVRRRIRRGKARGWGPYLVLLYGTAMTLGAFYFLSSGWAVLAMVVIWLSTLGLYVLMLLVGTTVTLAGAPRRLRDRFGDR